MACTANENDTTDEVDTNIYATLDTEDLDIDNLVLPFDKDAYVSIEIDQEQSDYDLSTAGEYTIVLILTDEDGETSEVSFTLVVQEDAEEESIQGIETQLITKLSTKEETVDAIASLAGIDGELTINANTDSSSSSSSTSNSSNSSSTSSSSTSSSSSSSSSSSTTDSSSSSSSSTSSKTLAELQQAVSDAQAVIDKGSLGFFEAYGYTEAVTYLNNSNSWTTSTYYSYTNIGGSKDATSLANMKTAIEMIIQGNNYRTSEGVSTLKISATLMAISQVNTNASAYTVSHTSRGNVGENLAWGYSDPYEGWYTMEKAVYDWLVNKGYSLSLTTYSSVISSLSNSEKNQIVSDCNLDSTSFIQVGHYINLVYPDYVVTGGAYNQYGNYGKTHGQVFQYSASDAKDATTFYNEFMTYYNKVYQDLADAQAALAAAS